MEDREYVSPDGELRLIVISPDGDLTIGFAGCPGHTHGSILAELSGLSEEQAAEHFIAQIVESRWTIAVWRISGRIREVWVPEHGGNTLRDVIADLARYGEPNETVEFRLWDGTKIEPPTA